MQGRTHNCGELRLENAGQEVRLVGWYENIRKVSKNLGFLILRDFYGTTQIVVETEEIMDQLAEMPGTVGVHLQLFSEAEKTSEWRTIQLAGYGNCKASVEDWPG